MKTKSLKLWNEFWTAPASPRPFGVLRIGVALILLIQAYCVAPHFFEIYGSDGILQGSLRSLFANDDVPGVYQVGKFLSHLGISEVTTLSALGGLYLFSVVSLLFGYQTRLAAFFTWLTSLILSAGHVSSYGLDTFASITLFYFLWMPIGCAYSLDVLSGKEKSTPTKEARVSLRILQLHLSIAYLACGLDKAMGIQWWNGDAIWRSLLLPVYAHGDFTWLSKMPWLPVLLGWGTLVIECGYPIGMWIPRLRKYCLAAIVGLHLGIVVFLGLHLFGAIMILLSFSAFGVSAEKKKGSAFFCNANRRSSHTVHHQTDRLGKLQSF